MANLDLKYVKSYTDRHGTRRHYFRRKGHTGGPLPGKVGSQEFMEAYQGYMSVKVKPSGKKAGSFGRVITDYYKTAHFTNLAPSSRKLYKYALEPLASKHGHKPVALLTQDAVLSMIEEVGQRAPQMANLTRGVLLKVLNVAYGRRWIPRSISGKEIPLYAGGTHHTWTSEEMEAFEAKWPLGTRERLAYALLLYTGQRAGDCLQMKRRDAMAGVFPVVQEKTGVELQIPVHPELEAAIKAGPSNGLTIIGRVDGRPIKYGSFLVMMTKAIKAAGLPDRCVPHGLRKAILTRLAELGASDKQLAAVSGHKTAKEIARYTAKASQAILAREAMARLPIKKRTGGV